MEMYHEPLDRAEIKRTRSSRRLRHEAKSAVFLAKEGDLEKLRKKLGMRPSKICDLLRVHPSAWIRWTKGTRGPPPHVLQMLEWYLELQLLKGGDSRSSIENPPATVAGFNSDGLLAHERAGNEALAHNAHKNTTFIRAIYFSWILQGLILLSFILLILSKHASLS